MNDVIMHASVPNAPFGGTGESGHGYYHGRHGINEFTHTRTVVSPPNWLDKVLSFRYPPFDVKNNAKLAVKNTLGFKRGETMEEQKVQSPQKSGTLRLLLRAMVLLTALEMIDYRTGRRLGIANLLSSLSRPLLERLGR